MADYSLENEILDDLLAEHSARNWRDNVSQVAKDVFSELDSGTDPADLWHAAVKLSAHSEYAYEMSAFLERLYGQEWTRIRYSELRSNAR